MADELQALLDRITNDELKKADTEKERILAEAKQQASEIVRQARAEADATRSAAAKEAEMFAKKGQEALHQASRDILISLRAQLESRVSKAVNDLIRGSAKGVELGKIITNLITGFLQSDGRQDDIRILVAEDDLAKVEAVVQACLADDLRANVELAPAHAIAGGFKLAFRQSAVVYDFTDQALAETIAAYVSPKIAAVIAPEN